MDKATVELIEEARQGIEKSAAYESPWHISPSPYELAKAAILPALQALYARAGELAETKESELRARLAVQEVRAEQAEAKLAEVRAQVDKAGANAQLGNGGELEDPLANIKAILDSSPSLSGGGKSSGVQKWLTSLWARAEEEKQKTATAFDERDKMAGDRQAADEAGLLDDFHRTLEELFPRCGGDRVLPVERGSMAGAVEDTEPCPGCPGCPGCLFKCCERHGVTDCEECYLEALAPTKTSLSGDVEERGEEGGQWRISDSDEKPGAASTQPKDTLLSGDGERLEDLARLVDEYLPESRAADDAAFLRDLANRLSPEDSGGGFEHCKRCGCGNTVWFAPSPLWNAVMRGGSIDGDPLYDDLVCATCFMEIAEEKGIASAFKVYAEQVNVELETTSPSGRIWDEKRGVWSEPAENSSGVEAGEWIVSDDDGSEPISYSYRRAALAEVAHRLHRNWLDEGENGTYQEACEQAEEMLQGAEREPDSRDGVCVTRISTQPVSAQPDSTTRLSAENAELRAANEDGFEEVIELREKLKAMTEARDLCKRQTAEARRELAQTKERLEKTREAWRHEKERADSFATRLSEGTGGSLLEQAAEEFEAEVAANRLRRLSMEGGEEGLRERLVSDEIVAKALQAGQEVNWDLHRDQLKDHPDGRPTNRDVVRMILETAFDSATTQKPQDEEER